MPNRYSKTQRARIYDALVIRDGANCARCGQEPPVGRARPFDVDHIDINSANGDFSNLRLLCHPCNTSEWNFRHRNGVAGAPQLERERESENKSPATLDHQPDSTQIRSPIPVRLHAKNRAGGRNSNGAGAGANRRSAVGIKARVHLEDGSPELALSGYYEETFTTWLFDQIRALGVVSRQDAINSGSYRVGCSPLTVRRYLDKLSSRLGPLQQVKDNGQTAYILKGASSDGAITRE